MWQTVRCIEINVQRILCAARDQIDGRSLMPSEHIIKRKWRREKMQIKVKISYLSSFFNIHPGSEPGLPIPALSSFRPASRFKAPASRQMPLPVFTGGGMRGGGNSSSMRGACGGPGTAGRSHRWTRHLPSGTPIRNKLLIIFYFAPDHWRWPVAGGSKKRRRKVSHSSTSFLSLNKKNTATVIL